jgi:hypothetical protein
MLPNQIFHLFCKPLLMRRSMFLNLITYKKPLQLKTFICPFNDDDGKDMNNLSSARPHDSLASLVVNLPNSLQQSPIFSNSPSNVLSPHNGHQHLQFSSGHQLFPDQNSPTPSSRVQETVLTLHAYTPPEFIPSEPRI